MVKKIKGLHKLDYLRPDRNMAWKMQAASVYKYMLLGIWSLVESMHFKLISLQFQVINGQQWPQLVLR